MSKGETLLAAAPLLWQIDMYGGKIYSILHDYVLFAEHEEDVDIKRVREWLDYRAPLTDGDMAFARVPWRNLSCAERVAKALSHDLLRDLECGGLGGMRRALEVLTTTASGEKMYDAALEFVDSLEEFSTYFSAQAKDAFGAWGSLIFRFVMEDLPFEYVERLSRSFEIEPVPRSLVELPQLELDSRLFAVRYGDREPCILGNSRQFRLLEALLERQGRYVSFCDLAEAMGGDAEDADLLPAVKCRLVRRLREAGLEDLAQQIKVQPEHYGLFWA